MSRRDTPEPPHLVRLDDLYVPASIAAGVVSLLPGEADQPDHIQRTYGVTVVRDHCNRLAVTLADAFVIRDARMAAEAELTAEWMETQRRAEAVRVWGRARAEFWSNRYMFVLRATPIRHDITNAQQQQILAARVAMSELVLAAEAEAGIPAEVQAQLPWPTPTGAVRYLDAGDRPEDFPYCPPEETI